MQLGETIATYDIALALRGESGKFVVTSPAGETYQVTCEPNHSIVNLQWSGNGSNPQPFLIRKVAEPVSSSRPEKTGTGVSETAVLSRAVKTPFLIDGGDNESRAETGAALNSTSAVSRPDSKMPDRKMMDVEMMDVEDLDLLYQEVGADSEQPTAWVCRRSELQQDGGTRFTHACASFNELDAEIRRLHAQLDDIRYRARKKFYQAQVVAAGA
jgi:hypothetical protein